MTKDQILSLIEQDGWMMDVLRAVRDLHLPDWWIGAGFVRAKVWDYLHGYKIRTPIADIDVIYFDSKNTNEEIEEKYQAQLHSVMPKENWSVTNQARMHTEHNDAPYKNSEEALSCWVETPTCIAVRFEEDNVLSLIAPHGIDDLVKCIVRPTPACKKRMDVYRERIAEKNWKAKWPKLNILEK